MEQQFKKDYEKLCKHFNTDPNIPINVVTFENISNTFDVINACLKQVEESKYTPDYIKYIDEDGNLVEIIK
jgi:hypothetical protein